MNIIKSDNSLCKIAGLEYNQQIHACQLYNSNHEYKSYINRILAANKSMENRIFIITDQKEEIRHAIEEKSKKSEDLNQRDNIRFLSAQKYYTNDNTLKIDKLNDFINNKIGVKDHKIPSIVLISIDWKNIDSQHFIKNEININKAMPENCIFICQYNIEELSTKILSRLFQTHPLVIKGNQIAKNVYYNNPGNIIDKQKNILNFNKWLELLTNPKIEHYSEEETKIKYKTLFKYSNDAIILHNFAGDILKLNQRACELLKYKKSELLNMNIRELVPEEEFNKEPNSIEKLKEEGQICFQSQFVTSHNENIPVEISSRIINKKSGIIQGIIRDISDRKITENKLQESERKYRQLVETTGDIIFSHDSDGKITFVNQAGLEFSGYTKEEFLDKNITDFMPKDELKKLNKRKQKRLNGDMQHYHYETKFFNKKGKLIDVDVHTTTLSENGNYQGSLVVARDISERKKIEENRKRIEQQKHQSQKLETLGTLAGGIGHDFNNILTPIIGYSEIIQQQIDKNDPNYKYISEILKGCLRAKDLISQMLSFSRDTDQKKQPLNIIPIIKEALKLLRPSIPRTIKIERKLPDSSPLINADPTRIHQVIMNLCTNAYQAMEEKGGILSIEVKPIYINQKTSEKYLDLENGHYIKLVVSDTGKGIDRETREHIFEPFYTTKEEGTGMGLAVVHGIVKSHNGRISVYSDDGEGTTFNIYFPIIKSKNNPESKADLKIQKGSGSILLVDDRKDVTDTLKQMLISLGYQVSSVNSSRDALELYRQNSDKIDLLITDYIMPEMTGLELARKLNDIDSKLPKIMISGHKYQMSKDQIRETGINKILHKPLLIPDIAEAIDSVLKNEKNLENRG
jgi:PAS domain S-box-containing protein